VVNLTQAEMYDIIRRPVVTEKTTLGSQHNQVTFRVPLEATKPEIKAAVEFMFKVEVRSVQVVNVRGKEKRFGQMTGRRNHWKKAYVSLKAGQEINFAEQAEAK
jgi:large subunit ribosomal protein L23